MANNAVITQKQENIIMILGTSSDKRPIMCTKMNKGSAWCFPPKFCNALIYLSEIPIVKIKYNIRFYRPNSEFDSVLEIEEVYTSWKPTFQVLSYWYLNGIFGITDFLFFLRKKACVWYLVTRIKNLILTGMKRLSDFRCVWSCNTGMYWTRHSQHLED